MTNTKLLLFIIKKAIFTYSQVVSNGLLQHAIGRSRIFVPHRQRSRYFGWARL